MTEFVIEIRIPLPEGIREQAKKLGSIDAAVEDFKEDLRNALGEDGFAFTEGAAAAKRAPRAPRSDAGQPRPQSRGPRGSRASATPNGSSDPATV